MARLHPDTTKLNRLDENLAAVNEELTPEELLAIQSASPCIKLIGAQYSESHAKISLAGYRSCGRAALRVI